jgi:hypothetical protein
VHGVPAVGTASHALGCVAPVAAEVVDVPGRKRVDAVLGLADASVVFSKSDASAKKNHHAGTHCLQTGTPSLTCTLGSPKLRTPAIVPKYYKLMVRTRDSELGTQNS